MKIRFIIIALLIVVLMATMLSLDSFAAETELGDLPEAESNQGADVEMESEISSENVGSTEQNDAEQSAEVDINMFFERVMEYCSKYKAEILTVIGDVLIFIFVVILKGLFKRKSNKESEDLSTIIGNTAATKAQQSAMVVAMNGLITGYNDMRDSYNKYESVEDDRNKLVGAVMVQNTAILDILQTVYANSKNLPQGVKDVITLKYANAVRSLGQDDVLLAIVESVREKVNAGTSSVTTDGGDQV